jgi:hypothetical protein
MSLEKNRSTLLSSFVSLSHFSFVETCVHPGERSESSKSINGNSNTVPKALFLSARKAWPKRSATDRLSAPIRRVYDSWVSVPEAVRLTALGTAVNEGFTRLPGRNSIRAQCRDLTLSGSSLPESHADVVSLTAEQVGEVGAPPSAAAATGTRVRRGPTQSVQNSSSWVGSDPVPGRGRSSHRQPTLISLDDGGGEPDEEEVERRSRSAPPSSERARVPSPAASIHTDQSQGISLAEDRRVVALERKLAQQDELIRQLFAQQLAESHEDVSSSYVVLDEVWHKVGEDAATDRCSWLNIDALKKREAGEIIRMHSGTFPQFPCELDVIGTLKKLPGVKDA